MRKALLFPALSTVLVLAACNSSSGTANVRTDGTSSVDASSVAAMDSTASVDAAPAADSSVQPDSVNTDTQGSSVAPAADGSPQAARVIEVSVASFAFSPNAIIIKKGENVVIRLKGVDGSHGFGVPELGINVPIAAGETKDVTIPTDAAGTFAFRCTVPCGPGHRDMKGTIVIS